MFRNIKTSGLSMKNKRTIRVISLIAVAAVVVWFILFQTSLIRGKDPDPAAKSGAVQAGPAGFGQEVVPVKAIRIQRRTLEDVITVNGSTAPNEEVTVSSEVPGKVVKILFKEGTVIQKGAALVQLDDTELQAQRKRSVVQQELNQKIADRLRALYEKEGVSLQEYEVAKAEVEKVKAEISLIDAQIEKRTVRSPFNGRLGLRQISEGSYLSPGSPIVNLVSINPIKLEFSVPEKYSQAVQPGSKVNFKLDGLPDDFTAVVQAAEPNIDPATRTYKLKATAPNERGRILPGAFASVKVSLKNYEATILVPTEAVVPELGGKKVYVYRSGKAQPVVIETGIRQDATIQVVEGLKEGDTLITSGVLQIRPGGDVTITTLE